MNQLSLKIATRLDVTLTILSPSVALLNTVCFLFTRVLSRDVVGGLAPGHCVMSFSDSRAAHVACLRPVGRR